MFPPLSSYLPALPPLEPFILHPSSNDSPCSNTVHLTPSAQFTTSYPPSSLASTTRDNPFEALLRKQLDEAHKNNMTSQPQSSLLFGNPNEASSQQGGGGFGQPQQPQPTNNIFGGWGQQQPKTTSISDPPNQQQLQQPPPSNPFGSFTQQPQPQPISIFNTSNQPQQTSISGPLFGYQSGQQQGQQQGGGIAQPQTRLWQQTEPSPRMLQLKIFIHRCRVVLTLSITDPRPVTTQMEVAFSKWNPESSNTLFQTYLYNSVPPDQAPFYSPGPQDDEGKWEEALRKKPAQGAIPVLVKGFAQLGRRVIIQHNHLQILQGRLHEIDGGLRDLLKNHDLQVSIRAAECKRKHLRLNHQCLLLAAKVQVLRNRGYSMDSAEEELREKILKLERSVFDPTLNGRGEEIWARMVSLRESSRHLQRDLEKAGKSMGQVQVEEIDEEVMRRARKVRI